MKKRKDGADGEVRKQMRMMKKKKMTMLKKKKRKKDNRFLGKEGKRKEKKKKKKKKERLGRNEWPTNFHISKERYKNYEISIIPLS